MTPAAARQILDAAGVDLERLTDNQLGQLEALALILPGWLDARPSRRDPGRDQAMRIEIADFQDRVHALAERTGALARTSCDFAGADLAATRGELHQRRARRSRHA